MQNIQREKYLNRIRPFYNKQLIKVLTGQRRVGKSFVLRQIADELLQLNPTCKLIYINKELHEYKHIQNDTDLIQYVKAHSQAANNVLLIDEVQEITDFERALRSLLAQENFDIYCTGSNSKLFSGELATFLSGRQIEVPIHSLSYAEYVQFHQLPNATPTLIQYLQYGGLPYLIHLPKDDAVVYEYLKNILATILFRDVMSRHEVRDVSFFDNLVSFLADNTGSPVSANKISAYLKSQRVSKSVSVVVDYLGYLTDAHIVHRVKRQDVQGKKIFEIGEKYYFEDLGLRNVVNGFRAADISKVIENAVFNHLQFLGYQVHTGKLGNLEIDFVAQRNNETIYIQATYLLTDDKVIHREFGNLDQINDHYPKYVVSMDTLPPLNSYKGIKHLSLLDFLNATHL